MEKIKVITCKCGGDLEAHVMPIRPKFQRLVEAAAADGYRIREEDLKMFKFNPCVCKRRPRLQLPIASKPAEKTMVEFAPLPAPIESQKVIIACNDENFNF